MLKKSGSSGAILRLPLLLAVFAAGLSSARADEDWWDEAWTLRKEITVDAAAAGATDQPGAVSVVVRLSQANYTFQSAKEDGTDIRFVASDNKTVLPFYIERFDALLNEAHVWVKPDAVKPGGKTTFWLYYGNSGPKAVKADNASTIVDADTVLNWHFSDNGAPPNDSTTNANHGDQPAPAVSGHIGGAISLTATTAVTAKSSPSLQWVQGGNMTWSAWVRPGAAPSSGNILTREEGANSFIIAAENGALVVKVKNAGGEQRSAPGQVLPANSWQHVAVVAGSNQVSIYVDGTLYSSAGAALPPMNSPITIGAATTSSGAVPGFICELDEMQIASVARSVSWIKFAHGSQGSGDKVVTAGADQQGDTGWFAPGSTTAILIGSLTVDGWIVIALLAVMGVISWWVMYTKMKYINGIAKGNHSFMNVWKHVSRDLTVLDNLNADTSKTLGGKISPEGQKAIRQSSVFRIYHIGAEEIRHRIEADGGGNGLSGRSIQAIKASMDGGMVRESQKLSRLIVLLTICISGGPFLGLLGTVIGVMITFAAIAAAGDVNVNSIAPGIAAALVATVAGLAVAIPALFGYNYIQSRVKDANTDMHVFIDEFVTRMAEYYPERRA